MFFNETYTPQVCLICSKIGPISANFLDASTYSEIPTSCRQFCLDARAT